MKAIAKLFPYCLALLGCWFFAAACQHEPQAQESLPPLSPPAWSRLANLLPPHGKLYAEELSTIGPFPYKFYADYPLTLSPGLHLQSDFYQSKRQSLAPLVLIIHGNAYTRKAHRRQAHHIASWGFHCLLVDLPNRKHHWLKNGQHVKKLVDLIHTYPQILSSKLNHRAIFLVGHSFGGSAVVLAAAAGAPAQGLILLDPAVVEASVIKKMQKIQVPVVLLGADEKIFRARQRQEFFPNIPAPMLEVSLKGATHTDAQDPRMSALQWGFDWLARKPYQQRFLAGIMASLFSLAYTGELAVASQFFREQVKAGYMTFSKARLKP